MKKSGMLIVTVFTFGLVAGLTLNNFGDMVISPVITGDTNSPIMSFAASL